MNGCKILRFMNPGEYPCHETEDVFGRPPMQLFITFPSNSLKCFSNLGYSFILLCTGHKPASDAEIKIGEGFKLGWYLSFIDWHFSVGTHSNSRGQSRHAVLTPSRADSFSFSLFPTITINYRFYEVLSHIYKFLSLVAVGPYCCLSPQGEEESYCDPRCAHLKF